MSRKEQPSINPEHEHKAAMAEHAYLSIDPWVTFGSLPSKQLQGWHADLLQGRRTPQRRFHAAWMIAESGYSLYSELTRKPTDTPERPEVIPLFATAKEEFDELAKERTASQVLQLQGKLGAITMPVVAAYLGDPDPELFSRERTNYLLSLGNVGESALGYVKAAKQTHDVVFMQALTILNVLNDEQDFLLLPAASRFVNARVGQAHQSQLYVFDLLRGKGFNAAVTADKNHSATSVDPALLAHSEYKAKHPYGTLQAVVDVNRQNALDKQIDAAVKTHNRGGRGGHSVAIFNAANSEYRKLEPGRPARLVHLHQVADSLKDALVEGLSYPVRNLSEKIVFQTKEDVISYYASLPPDSSVSAEYQEMQRAVSFLDKSSLDQEETAALASMHLDIGMYEASQNKFSAKPHFTKAEVLYDGIARNAAVSGDRKTYYLARIARIAVPLYAAVGTRATDVQEQIETYTRELSILGQQLLEEKDALRESQPQQAALLTSIMPQIASLLLLSGEPSSERTHIAVPSTYRQNTSTGWGTTVWLDTGDGYHGEFFGKLSLKDASDPTLNPHSLTIEELGSGEDFLFNTLSVMWDDPAQTEGFAERLAWVNATRGMVKEVVDRSVED